MLRDRSRGDYDRNEVRRRAEEIVLHYLGPGKAEGDARLIWRCPACGKEEKYAVRRQDQKAGCFKDDCRLGGRADIFDFIAYQEGLNAKTQFVEVLARGYEVLGLRTGSEARENGEHERRKTRAPVAREKRPKPSPQETRRRLELCRRVNARIMALSPLEPRDREYLSTRGLSHETIAAGRFGSMSLERAHHIKKALLEEFGEEGLLSVPGFFKDEPSGKIGFTLTGDYLLVPYHDRDGNVTNVEGRAMGEIPEGMGKYVSLRGSGNHLYLFPAFAPEPGEIVAFTEGVFGAIVAAQSGIAVASIQGCKRYKASSSSFAPDGEAGEPLPEIEGIGFGGRTIPYIPDADDPPNDDVLNAAPEAAHHLIERQGGRAALCALPRGMDLDEWLASIPKERRQHEFAELISSATPLEQAEEWKLRMRAGAQDEKVGPTGRGPRTPPAPDELTGEEASAASAGGARDDPRRTPAGTDLEERPPERPGDSEPAQPAPEADREPHGGGGNGGGEENEEGITEGEPPESKKGKKPTGARRHRDEVYRALLAKCPPKDEHKEALARLGVMAQAVAAAKLGSLDPARTGRVVAELKDEFGAKRLLSVPGFERGTSGRVSLGLPARGEHVLLPCFDAEGLLTGLEALAYDPETGQLPDPDKTVPLSGAGAHLYVFAFYSPEEIEGFCEGPVGAILAAQEDVVLGAIGHFRRHAADAGSAHNEERVGAVLPGLEGVDFGGREISYVPRVGPGEKNARSREAQAACRSLIERQNGIPQLRFPSPLHEQEEEQDVRAAGKESGGEEETAADGPLSLAEWVLSLPEEERQRRLKALFPQGPARRRPSPDDDASDAPAGREEYGEGDAKGEGSELPPGPVLSALGLVGLAVAVATYVLVGRLQHFSEWVGVGYGGQPFAGGGMEGALRMLAAGQPFETLYALKLPVSALLGLAVSLLGLRYWNARKKLDQLSVDLRGFAEGPWRAHLVGQQEEGGPRGSLPAVLTRRGALEGLAAGAVAYALLYPLVGALEWLYGAMAALGMAGGRYEEILSSSGSIAAAGAVVLGLYVLYRRIALRGQRRRLIEGKIRP